MVIKEIIYTLMKIQNINQVIIRADSYKFSQRIRINHAFEPLKQIDFNKKPPLIQKWISQRVWIKIWKIWKEFEQIYSNLKRV